MSRPAETPQRAGARVNPTEFPTLFQSENKSWKSFEEPLVHFEDYLKQTGHNLQTVLINPREGRSFENIFSVQQEQPTPPVSQVEIPTISIDDVQPFLRKSKEATKTFLENHLHDFGKSAQAKASSLEAEVEKQLAKCFDTVPSAFFAEDYSLEHPQTFEAILSRPNGEMQDKLSGYLDIVEACLLKKLESRAEFLIHAMSSHDDLSNVVTSACSDVGGLRKNVKNIDASMCHKSLRVSQLSAKQKQLTQLYDSISQIEEILQIPQAVQAFVQENDFDRALGIISRAKLTLNTTLKGVHCLKNTSRQLDGYCDFISTQMSDTFIKLAVSSAWDDVIAEESAVESETSNHYPHYESLEKQIMPLVIGLARMGRLRQVLQKYAVRLQNEVKVVVKTVVSETIETSASTAEGSVTSDVVEDKEADSKVAGQLRSLQPDDFCSCLEMTFEHLLMVLNRASKVAEMITDLVCTEFKINGDTDEVESANESLPRPPEDDTIAEIRQSLVENKNCVKNACELAQRSVAQLVAIRKEVQARYQLSQLSKLWDVCMGFILQVEKVTGTTGYTLRGTLLAQLKRFLELFHETHKNSLLETLNNEKWKQVFITIDRQQALDALANGKFVPMHTDANSIPTDENAAETPTLKKYVVVEGHQYRVVWSCLLLLEIVINYLSCAGQFPALASDVLQKVVELLRLFNSRTTQLVLGAGAMQVAGLKSITAKHLGLASQALGLIAAELPHVKAALSMHLPPKQRLLLVEMDRCLQDYAEHSQSIFAKVISIIEDLSERSFAGKWRALPWDGDQDTRIPSPPINDVVRGTVTLHKVLQQVLPPEQMQEIFSRVLDLFDRKLLEYIGEPPATEKGKIRMLGDIMFLLANITRLDKLDLKSEAVETKLRQKLGLLKAPA